MVNRLLDFVEASHTRNWLQHLSAAEAPMQHFISMDRIKCRKGWMAYVADMKETEAFKKVAYLL